MSDRSIVVEIRRAVESDIPSIQRIAARTWADTYQNVIPPEAQQKVLSRAYSTESLTASIRRGQAFLVAVENDIVGYVDVEFDGSVFHLHRLYVLPASQRSGLGRRLLWEAVRALAPNFTAPNDRWRDVPDQPRVALPAFSPIPPGQYRLVAHVERDNPKARAFYAKMGFGEDNEENVVVGGVTLPLIRISVGISVPAAAPAD